MEAHLFCNLDPCIGALHVRVVSIVFWGLCEEIVAPDLCTHHASKAYETLTVGRVNYVPSVLGKELEVREESGGCQKLNQAAHKRNKNDAASPLLVCRSPSKIDY